MREIKFRGKRLDNGEWEYGDLLQYDDWGCVKQRYEDFIHDNPEFLKGGEQ